MQKITEHRSVFQVLCKYSIKEQVASQDASSRALETGRPGFLGCLASMASPNWYLVNII